MMKEDRQKAVITVLGSDRVGIVAKVTTILAEHNANIIDITQTLLDDLFSMIMMVEVDDLTTSFEELQKDLEDSGEELGVKIMLQHEKAFRYMHRI